MRHEHLTCSLMEVTAGYHPTALEFEDVGAAIGLDKTSVGRGTALSGMAALQAGAAGGGAL